MNLIKQPVGTSKHKNDNASSTPHHFIDTDLQNLIHKRLTRSTSKLMVIATGLTSSHLGDERNLREFLFASEVDAYLRDNDINTLFLLTDDSYDPLNFRQLRVAVNKDETLITKFEKYCGMPLKFIPDPFACHNNYSAHFQDEILKRFHSVGIFPTLVDSYSAYKSGLYDFAKDIVFSRYEKIKQYLKEKFPSYTMKKLFYPVCPDCRKMDNVDVTEISGTKIHIHCHDCDKSSGHQWKHLQGKFSWKIDTAVKWNVYKTDFEPYSKAYLDPNVGSYFIAKALSQQFFGGNVPEIIEYGQVIMDKSFSFTLIHSLPLPAFRAFYLTRRKSDIKVSVQKIIQAAKEYTISQDLTYYDYIHSRLPYDLLEHLNGKLQEPFWQTLLMHGQEFTRRILNREPHPQLPTPETLGTLTPHQKQQIRSLLLWVLSLRRRRDQTFTDFSNLLHAFLIDHQIQKTELFPIMRKLLGQDHGVPINRLFYFVPHHYLYACLALIDELNEKNKLIS